MKDYSVIEQYKKSINASLELSYDEGYEQGFSDGNRVGYENGKASTIKESEQITNQDIADAYKQGYEKGLDDNAFSEEDCIALLQKTGWMEKHDKEIYLNGMDDLKKALSNKAYLKANFNTGNWLNIIRDFSADKIVKEWKDFHSKEERRESLIKKLTSKYTTEDILLVFNKLNSEEDKWGLGK